MTDNLFLGNKKMISFLQNKNIVAQIEKSDINKTYIDSGIRQKFELWNTFKFQVHSMALMD